MKYDGEFYEYGGVIHVHTTDSDGTRTHAEIIKTAQELNLDFCLFTDHETLRSKSAEGWYEDLLVIVGYELNDRDNHHHFLAFLLEDEVEQGLAPAEYVQEVARRDGFGIIAHPDEVRNSRRYPPYPWKDWSTDDYKGIEIWNQLSAWTEGITSSKRLWVFFHPRSFLTTPTREVLKIWDQKNLERKVVGIGSTDAHEHNYGFFPFRMKIFPYKVHFTSIRSYLLTRQPLSQDFKIAERSFFDNLGECHLYFANYRMGDPSGFRFFIGKSL